LKNQEGDKLNKLVMYPFLIMAILALFNQFYYYSNNEVSISGEIAVVNPATGEISENGTSTEIQTSGTDISFDLNTVTGFIALIIGVVILGTVLGITFVGSGLSERSQKIIFNSVVCFGFWGIFSALTLTLIMLIPTFGLILWIALTMVYTFGFFKIIDGGN